MQNNKQLMVTKEQALPDKSQPIIPSEPHAINASILSKNTPPAHQQILLGMGCFWGAERLFWQCDGVSSTSVGYSGGFMANPSYQDVCTAQTGHAEVVQVVFDPSKIALEDILTLFWENHDATQTMRQGNDIGTQYRSAIYYVDESQKQTVIASKKAYQHALIAAGNLGEIATEIGLAGPYYFAETSHQQYLHKNPNGYCGLAGVGVCLPKQPA